MTARDELREYADRYGYTDHVNALIDAVEREVLNEAANALASLGPEDSLVSGPKAWDEAVTALRRIAAERGGSS